MRIQSTFQLQQLMQNSVAFKALVYLVIAVASPLVDFKNYSVSTADIPTSNTTFNYTYSFTHSTSYQPSA